MVEQMEQHCPGSICRLGDQGWLPFTGKPFQSSFTLTPGLYDGTHTDSNGTTFPRGTLARAAAQRRARARAQSFPNFFDTRAKFLCLCSHFLYNANY